jgi:isoamylase
MEDEPRYYMDYTGTGNSMNMVHPQVLKLIMDSLRYWVTEMHVDGFRFDLAATLARELHEVDRLSAFFDIIHQDPILSGVKLIAEPWDLGPGGYQVGNFPVLWAEWNGKYRDAVRSYWRGTAMPWPSWLPAHRVQRPLRRRRPAPTASINFITAHDGFTLNDLVSYEQKHNEANGEGNRDGHDHNLSSNHGAEGPTDDPAIRGPGAPEAELHGDPPLLPGRAHAPGRRRDRSDPGGQQQRVLPGQRDQLVRLGPGRRRRDLLEFTRRAIRLRKAHPALRRRRFFQGVEIRGSHIPDITWLTPRPGDDGRGVGRRLGPGPGLPAGRRGAGRCGREGEPGRGR